MCLNEKSNVLEHSNVLALCFLFSFKTFQKIEHRTIVFLVLDYFLSLIGIIIVRSAQINLAEFNVYLEEVNNLKLLIFLVYAESSLVYQVISAGKELLACLTAFKELGSCNEGRSALAAAFYGLHYIAEDHEAYKGHEKDGNGNSCLPNEFEWRKCPPLLCCCKNLLRSADSKDGLSSYAIEAVNTLCIGSLWFCLDGER